MWRRSVVGVSESRLTSLGQQRLELTVPSRICPSCNTPLPDQAHFCFACGLPTPPDTRGDAEVTTPLGGALSPDRLQQIRHPLGAGAGACLWAEYRKEKNQAADVPSSHFGTAFRRTVLCYHMLRRILRTRGINSAFRIQRGVYSNVAIIGHTELEFVIGFRFPGRWRTTAGIACYI